ncbi:hypothetical protein CFC21_033813 [Triticum aestivum]|uniref:Transmembrane protein n=3 Tax=Triticum TaxID=4564 RepID=A0A9R0RAL5_TRITD|nr:hypothetical protein CFC21_033813 [Triticum aestivum]VAH56493.1 unnamed protein product [Triticum turgidum subsp. durum]
MKIYSNVVNIYMQGTGNDDHTIQMPPDQVQESASMDQRTQQLARDICKISVPTLVIAIGTALYKSASGVLFLHHPLAYYCGLAAIFVAGVGETLAAYWLACSRDANGRHFTIGKAVWWASIVPLIFVLGIGGCHVIVGY